jgi:lipopolysaccharide/colanic/teichoic acid biosynthesis glycosyltransferase
MLTDAGPKICSERIGSLEPDMPRKHAPKRPTYVWTKLVAEWVIALLLAFLTAPVVLLLALLVKFSSRGPAFYCQGRLGLQGRPFRIIKLRTMRHNCEAESGPVWSLPGDGRVTRLGRILRDTHLDELPQLFNVLLGHMSLVGPRPERPEIAAQIERSIPEFRWRLLVRPGVTGLAQMRLPADTDFEGVRLKLAHDLYYARELSFQLDLRIAFSTAFYFLSTLAHAICVGLVSSYGRAVERGLPKMRGPGVAEAAEMGAVEA